MSRRISLTVSGLFLAGLTFVAFGGCASVPVEDGPPEITATPAQVVPVDAPVEYVERSDMDGHVFNTLGGEIPITVPTPQVEQGELGEIGQGEP